MAVSLSVLKQRADFLAAAESGLKFVRPHLIVQARKRKENEVCRPAACPDAIRVGFTVTHKLGGAVLRNRAKRRLRSAAMKLVKLLGVQGCDYVFIGRKETIMGTFDDLIDDMKHALKRLADMMSS